MSKADIGLIGLAVMGPIGVVASVPCAMLAIYANKRSKWRQ